jgi:DNA invertase Pin-like site-specific DNA recombinase
MIYGYIRVSTDRQTVKNQRFEINEFCKRCKIKVGKWIDETISGAKEVDKRKLGELLDNLRKGDILICSELSRLGRNLLMIMSILNFCMEKEVEVWTIKDNYRLGSDISSKVLAFAFGLSAEIERNLISQRTKEALARMKSEGIHVGRPRGAKSKEVKLTGKGEQIKMMLKNKIQKVKIAKDLGVHRSTLRRFLLEAKKTKRYRNRR